VRAYVGSEVRPDGKRRNKYAAKVVKGTFKQAQKALAALTTDIGQGTFIPPAKQTLREYLAGVDALRLAPAPQRRVQP
jgi:hypothetical protein